MPDLNDLPSSALSAAMRGGTARAEKCYEKSQFWLDRFNLLSNRGERPDPKR